MHLLKFIYRKTLKNKTSAFINVFCLSVAFGLAISLFLYVQREFSVDKYHSKKDRIVRLVGKEGSVWTNTLLGPWLKEKYPEVEHFVRTRNNETCLISYHGEDHLIKGNMLMDSSVSDVFDFNLILGDKKSALTNPFSVVITEKTAKKIFGNKNPIGEKINFNKTWDHTVTGVMEDIPENSTFNIDIIFPFHAIEYHWKDSVGDPFNILDERYNFSFHTYLLLKNSEDVINSQDKICTDIQKEFEANYKFQPLTDIYFDVIIGDRWLNNGNKSSVLILFSIALGLILISVLNFINLNSALILNNLSSLGIRKTIGSGKISLLKQYIVENILYMILSLVLGIFIALFTIHYLNNLLHVNITLFSLLRPHNILIFTGLLISLIAITSIYPLWIISKDVSPAHLKGAKESVGLFTGRNLLVPAQFILTIVFIIAAITIINQIHFIKNKNLGFEKERLLYVIMNTERGFNTELFKNELLKNPEIIRVSYSAGLFGDIRRGNTVLVNDQYFHYNRIYTDPNYIKTLGYEVIKGRDFSYDFKSDFSENTYIINETMAKKCNFTDPLQESIHGHPIVGIVKDFNIEPLQKVITPIAFVCNPERANWVINIKLANDNIENNIKYIEGIWEKINPDFPMIYSFADDRIMTYYQNEMQFSRLSIMFSVISVILSCFGLIGLVMHTIQNKTKEIGIRKVNGATIIEILSLLNSSFIKWIIIAFVIASPIGYKIMNIWLDHFAYKISLNWGIFALTGILVITIAGITITFQCWDAARKNPVEALRYE